MRAWLFLAALLPLASSFAQPHPQERAIQRALVERDQQSAEFAAQLRGGTQARLQLEALHARQLQEAGRPLSPDPEVARQLRPYERERLAAESQYYVLRLPPPAGLEKSGSDPEFRNVLPLPGGPRPGVELVAPQSVGN